MKHKILLSVMAIIIIGVAIAIPKINVEMKFSKATSLMDSRNYQEAMSIFNDIKGRKQEAIRDYCRDSVIALCQKEEYDTAANIVDVISSDKLVNETEQKQLSDVVDYATAASLEKTGNYTDAYYQYIRLGNYEESAEKADAIFENHKADFYKLAIANYQKNTKYDLEYAKTQFEKLGDYEDAEKYLIVIDMVDSMSGTFKNNKNGDMISIDGLSLSYYFASSQFTKEYQLQTMTYEARDFLVAQRKDSTDCYAFIKDNIGDKIQAYEGKLSDDYTSVKTLNITDINHPTFHRVSEESNQISAPTIGMTAEEVENSTWGKPEKINTTTYSWGTSEQWVYSTSRYVYLDNGVVTAIQK